MKTSLSRFVIGSFCFFILGMVTNTPQLTGLAILTFAGSSVWLAILVSKEENEKKMV